MWLCHGGDGSVAPVLFSRPLSTVMPFLGLFFDIDGTLLGLRPAPEVFYRQVCQEFELDCVGLPGARAVAVRFVEAHGLEYLADEPAMWRAANREVFLYLGAGDQAAACASRFQALFYAGTEQYLYPDVLPALAGLRARGYLLGAITGRLHSGERVLVELGVRPYLAFYLYAGELGVQKPDPRLYREALARAGLPAAAVLLVGDRPDDVVGARSVGLTPVLVARGRQAAGGEVWQVSDLRELLGALPPDPLRGL